MSKYTSEFKLDVINHYLSTGDGYKTTAELYDLQYHSIRKWVCAFNIHGLSSLTKRYTSYTSDFKLSVLQYMDQHQFSINQAAAHFNIPSPSTIAVWQKLYNEDGLAALQAKPKGRAPMPKPFKPFTPTNKPVTQMTPDELMQELEYRRMETDYLKKLEALAQQKHLASKSKSK
jgi:transposase-like protein